MAFFLTGCIDQAEFIERFLRSGRPRDRNLN